VTKGSVPEECFVLWLDCGGGAGSGGDDDDDDDDDEDDVVVVTLAVYRSKCAYVSIQYSSCTITAHLGSDVR